jgi:hypothetical protein
VRVNVGGRCLAVVTLRLGPVNDGAGAPTTLQSPSWISS